MRSERDCYQRAIARSIDSPQTVLTIEIDGWNKNSTQLPHEGPTKSKYWASKTKWGVKVMGAVAHGSLSSFMFCMDSILPSSGADLTVECLHQLLHHLEHNDKHHYPDDERQFPAILHLQLDNCSVSRIIFHCSCSFVSSLETRITKIEQFSHMQVG